MTSATARKPYHTPEVRDLGAVREVTETSTTPNAQADIGGAGEGSVYAS